MSVSEINGSGENPTTAVSNSGKPRSGQDDDDDVGRSMARRRKSDRPADVMHSCRECGKEFKRPCDLTKHEKTHSRPWKCTEKNCKYYELGWPNEKERDRHVLDKHSSSVVQYRCHYPPCTYVSKRESNCKQHMEKAHGWEYVRSKSNGKKSHRSPESESRSSRTLTGSTPSTAFSSPAEPLTFSTPLEYTVSDCPSVTCGFESFTQVFTIPDHIGLSPDLLHYPSDDQDLHLFDANFTSNLFPEINTSNTLVTVQPTTGVGNDFGLDFTDFGAARLIDDKVDLSNDPDEDTSAKSPSLKQSEIVPNLAEEEESMERIELFPPEASSVKISKKRGCSPENEERPAKRQKKPPRKRDKRRLMSCIFRKHSPDTYNFSNNKFKTCHTTSHEYVSTLVRHLERYHDAILCHNCLINFSTQAEGHSHKKAADCTPAGGSQEDKWHKLYERLCSDGVLHDPIFESACASNAPTPCTQAGSDNNAESPVSSAASSQPKTPQQLETPPQTPDKANQCTNCSLDDNERRRLERLIEENVKLKDESSKLLRENNSLLRRLLKWESIYGTDLSAEVME
ncbi:hypothetical protein K491DRAFT_111833 [Lophiostoma macrostomum CBS 122681]|uniref:C2H2-type domain-containing protein n=1 Tax=Lophiostoma macrostomum CBS 122681 TaxID=1314788 RepID=A0A6A6SWZ4_9PLEO|nr:hypothetical protein K491DRAFT_111833 [Lophiostoma macrostomum CBS 122681]